MKRAFLIWAAILAAVLAAGLAWADGPLGGEAKGGGTNRVVTSKVMTERGWRRDIVTVDELGQIHNDGGKIAQTAETEAINEVADSSGEIADAANASMTNSMNVLYSKTNDMATAGLGIAIAFAPETDDINLRGFVVKTETEGSTDIQWVWYNNELSLAPNRFVTYETYDKVEKIKVNWGKWDAAGTNLTVNGRVWSGCHRCTVTRPSWAVGKSCLDCPNETWGGENGMEWGDMTLTYSGGLPYFTGYVTNSVAGIVAYFDNGFLKEISSVNP